MYACLIVSLRHLQHRIAYSLRVDLVDVGQSLCQHVARHLVSVLVPELGSFASRTVNRCSGVGNGAGHDAADRWRDLEDMGDGGGIDEFVLWMSAQSINIESFMRTGTFFCERTTAQSFPRTPTEVMLAAVIALNAYSENI